MILYPEYHYDGDCGVAKLFMRLSGWVFNAFALAELPKGYVENGDFGPRVAKYDWFELLAKFPLLIVLLVIAGLTTFFWLFWLCCSVRGLQKSTKKRHRCCLYFTTLLLLLLLLPLSIGLYLTFRTNFLLRRTKDDSKTFEDTARSALYDEDVNFMNQAEYKTNPTQVSIEINKVISDEFADWHQKIAQTEQTNFEKLKYLYNNGNFYSTALQSLRDNAYELVILGIEMDDLLRTLVREAFVFLQTNVKNTSLIESKVLKRERINVWHLNSVYSQYLHSYEYLEYLVKAYENISLLQKSIAESTLSAEMSEDDLFVTPSLRELPNMDDRSSTEHSNILDPILYLAMAMFLATAALAYILLMALGFGICRYYARANCMLKIFLFLNILTIPVLAFLTVLHFLPAMVLHTGICYEDDLRGLRGSSYRIAEPRRCDPVNNIVANEAYDYKNYELSTTQQMRDNILPKVERMLPKIKTNHENYTSNQQVVVEFAQEREWYESDVQGLITDEDYTSYAGYIKEYNKENATGADIFSCKLNSIPKTVRTDLYDKTFVPIIKELYEVLTKLKQHAQPKGYENFTKLLESAQSELVGFEKLYALSKDNLLATLSDKLDKKMREYNKSLRNRSVPCYRGHSSAMNGTSKCGCLEDLLMLYAIGSALLVFTLFFTMLLSLLLYKLYKRGPPIFACPQPPKPDGCLRAPVAGTPCEQIEGTAAQSTKDGRDCAVPQTGVNCGVAHAGTPLINTVNFIPPVMGAFGCQQNPPMIYPTKCQQSSPQMCAGTSQRNPPQMCATSCQRNPPQMRETNCQRSTTQMCGTSCQRSSTHICSSSRKDSVILPLPCRSRTQTNCVGAEAQLVGGGTTKDKTVTVMVFQGPKDRQPLVTYPPPQILEKK